jgi:hypothetical protein
MNAQARARDDLYFRARAAGLDVHAAQFVSDQFWNDRPEFAARCIRTMLLGVAKHRTKYRMKRYIIHNRRSYNAYRASIDAHMRGVQRRGEGMRCPECSHIPPQPGEVMEEGWENW